MALGTSNPYPRSIGSFQVPVAAPDVDPDAEPLATICLNADWLPLVLGALQQLTLQATWQGDEDAVTLAVNRAQLLLSMVGSSYGGCTTGLCITGVFYDPDCDCIMWTPPGSETTVEAPQFDPRHADGFRFPPNTAEDQKCQAAANMTRFISDLIGEVILIVDTAGNAEGLMAIILPFIVELGPFAILIELVLALAFLLFSIGATALAAVFTSEVYDQLTCIFFCNIASDGSVSAAQLESINSDIADDIDGLVQVVLTAMFALMGEVGLSNAGAIGSAPADCDDCDCEWCYRFDNLSDFAAWQSACYNFPTATCEADLTGGVWESSLGPTGGGISRFCIIEINFTSTYITRVEAEGITFGRSDAGSTTSRLTANSASDPVTAFVTAGSGNATVGVELTVEAMCDYMLFGVGANATSGGVSATGQSRCNAVVFHGRGVCPFGDPNC